LLKQDAISKDEKTEKDAKEKAGADKDKPDKAARDNKDKKEGKGFCLNQNKWSK